MKRFNTVVMAGALVLAVEAGATTLSDPVCINTFPDRNRCWDTVYTNETLLRWAWNWFPNTASSASLTISGMNGTLTTNFDTTVTNWVWRPFTTSVPAEEDAYMLTLTFTNAGAAVVGSLTSRLAVVKGAFSQAAIDPVTTSTTWQAVGRTAIIPYDVGWAGVVSTSAKGQLVIAKVGGVVRTNALTDACGYLGWQLDRSWGCYGTFDLSLSFPNAAANVWYAMLTRPAEWGSIYCIR